MPNQAISKASGASGAARRHYRFQLKSVVEFTRWDPKNNTFGFATDISVGGAFVETMFPAPLGSAICVRVWPPGWATEVLLPAVVRWRGPSGMGVEFLSVGPREALGIHALVIDHKSKQGRVDRVND